MEYYNAIAEGYDALHAEEQERKYRKILENMDVKRSDRMLDVGCGTGLSFPVFGCDCYGVDPSEELLKKCGGAVVLGRAESLPFRDSSFDIVISVTAIHNFGDPKKALSEMLRVGRDRFAITVLKKSKRAEEIAVAITNSMEMKKVEDATDIILIGKKFKQG